VINETNQATEQVCLFPKTGTFRGGSQRAADQALRVDAATPAVFGDCWLGCRLWDELELDAFWRERLPDGKAEVRGSKCSNC